MTQLPFGSTPGEDPTLLERPGRSTFVPALKERLGAPGDIPLPDDTFSPEDDFGAQAFNQDQFTNLPEGGDFWQVDGILYVVYTIPGSVPPVNLAWTVDPDDLETIAPGQTVTNVTSQEFVALGTIVQGPSGLIADRSEHPWESFFNAYEEKLTLMPWLEDPEFLALYAAAFVEGRSELTLAEQASTEWWQTHSETERDWLTFVNGDPVSANDLLDTNRRRTRGIMVQAGIDNPNDALITFLADQVTRGFWDQTLLTENITTLSDPSSPLPLDPLLADFLSTNNLAVDTTRAQEDTVRELVAKWLGPHYASFWEDGAIASWAGELRNDPDAQTELTSILRNQRLTLFPNFTNESLTYDDISAPMKGTFFNVWGQQADETDPFFLNLLAENDIEKANQSLRSEGLRRGIPKVRNDALNSFAQSFGGNLRRTNPAVL